MRFEPRDYQQEAVKALLQDVEEYNPVIAVPTGAGKTVIMGQFIYEFLEKFPQKNILVLAATKEILTQNHEAICEFFPGISIGLYSSGLKIRDIQKITVAGIQSVYRHPSKFKKFDLTIIDECHQIPPKGSSMYRKFLTAINSKCVGLSATVFRRGIGYIYKGKDRIFDKLSYDLSSTKSFNKLITDGYLCNLISRATKNELDTTGVKTTAGDFNQKQLAEKVDRLSITKAAVKEAVDIGQWNYHSWLVFAINIEHCENITAELNSLGIKSRALHTKVNGDRDEIIQQFKNKEIRCVVSVGMVTTGFDAPNIDLIVLLRPTKSAVLHVQMVGRGLRMAPGKTHCLVLDFAGNTSRLGPINNVIVPKPKGKKQKGKAPTKQCPKCMVITHTLTRFCAVCGHEFVFKEKIKTKADTVDIIQNDLAKKRKWLNVDKVFYKIHKKPGKPNSLKVIYKCRLNYVTEYICLDHKGYARTKAKNWTLFRFTGGLEKMPLTVDELYKVRSQLRIPARIKVFVGGRYWSIEEVEFATPEKSPKYYETKEENIPS